MTRLPAPPAGATTAPPAGAGTRLFAGWGGTSPSAARPVRPGDGAALAEALAVAAGEGRPLVARGLGRSYGDAAQCAGGTVVETAGLADDEVAPPVDGAVRVGAGTSLDALMRALLPLGWFVPVTPGTRQVTVGGAIAADIHGKNHHRDGTFAAHLRALTLHTPTGVHEVGPGTDPDLFWATAGGMGLTGIVSDATVELVAVESAYMVVDTRRAGDLDAAVAALAEDDARSRYSVAWIDCLARGRHLGRAVLASGNHATLDDLPARRRGQALHFAPRAGPRVPFTPPSGLLNPLTVAAFNEAWFRKAPRRREGELQHLTTFFHPLDGVRDWNRLYGRRGFLQYQFVVPFAAAETVRLVLERLSAAKVASFLAVLKRFGPEDPGPLSFPMAGLTLALDVPAGSPELGPLLDGLDEEVAGAGGRVYLAKDARLRPDMVRAMYPRLDEWRAVRDRVDPDHLLTSDLDRRLGLTMARPQREKGAVAR